MVRQRRSASRVCNSRGVDSFAEGPLHSAKAKAQVEVWATLDLDVCASRSSWNCSGAVAYDWLAVNATSSGGLAGSSSSNSNEL